MLTLHHEQSVPTKDAPRGLFTYDHKLTFAAQDERWVYKSLVIEQVFFPDAEIPSADKAAGKPHFLAMALDPSENEAFETLFQKAYDSISR